MKIIDFGSVTRGGLVDERRAGRRRRGILGTLQYTAPEYFVGDAGSERSDLYSLGVIAYQMLTGPAAVRRARGARAHAPADAAQARYAPALRRAARHPGAGSTRRSKRASTRMPQRRYEALSEFVHDLRHPNPAYLRRPLHR